MSQIIEVKVPDIGDFESVPVIDLFVKVGDSIKVDDAIVTLESDKATMDVPSTVAGIVKEVLVQLGSKVGEGALLIKVETGAASTPSPQRGEGAAVAPTPPPPSPPPRPAEVQSLSPLGRGEHLVAPPISSAKCLSSAPAPAVTLPPSARPTSA
jgi:pyruvate dehydrogenase E2 component (dihydrolipoamide acetyltransferase)